MEKLSERPTSFDRAVCMVAASFAIVCFVSVASGSAAQDRLEKWSTVVVDELSRHRGGSAMNFGDQDVGDNSSTGNMTTGSISMDMKTFNRQRMVINAFNTGNHVVMQNLLSVEINLTR